MLPVITFAGKRSGAFKKAVRFASRLGEILIYGYAVGMALSVGLGGSVVMV